MDWVEDIDLVKKSGFVESNLISKKTKETCPLRLAFLIDRTEANRFASVFRIKERKDVTT